MNIRELNKQQAKAAMSEWVMHPDVMPEIPIEWQGVRSDLQNRYAQIQEELGTRDYVIDVEMGLYLYDYLGKRGFTVRAASNDGFWRFMALKVIPDLVGKRWRNDADDHYWAKPARNWPCAIWWYVHMSWQGDVDKTRDVLSSPNFSTDTLLNLEERTGRYGSYIEVYRYIMYYYSVIDSGELNKINSSMRQMDKHATLFRTIMKLNTARTMTVEPALYLGGEMQYVKSLFREAGINLDEG